MSDSIRRLSTGDFGLLAMRVMLAVVFVYHGSQKLFGWFGGYGIEGTAGFFEKIGIPLPTVSVVMAGGTEFFAGLALGLGLLTRLSGAGLFFTMMVAAFTAHTGFSAQAGGMEYPLTLGIIAAGLALTGPGRLTVGALLPSSGRAEREESGFSTNPAD